ncbi:nicotinamide riboside transporter PnuC [Leptospira idonii]|uniref:Nicotinamide riboside transporter PnuC n=1 Tax=Leptospira idonii TaxID=1193500 RepID=A0A4R9M392_9LEPT|nr:nicotinamide riboside transporter PnuC [Leptospira idonii]TGN19759.1 nicotinamide riboside transporter PnuC [Leptospira idonii]
MDSLLHFLSLEFTVVTVWEYPLSLLEILGTISGLFCVYYASVEKIITWPIGIFNSICFFFLFYQVQLYSDMLLQIYFFGSSIYGWIVWNRKTGEYVRIHSLGVKKNLFLFTSILVFTYLLGEITFRLPVWFPVMFTEPPAFLYWDAFTTVASIYANFLLACRILESWFLWVLVDVVCIALYFLKNIPLVTIEYVIFLVIALYGCYAWYREYKTVSEKV